jgi:hypothetical protein
MRRIILCLVVAAACGDDARPAREDAGPEPDAPPAEGLVGCLDTPVLPMAPNGQLPCDLVPPGLRP